MRYRGEGAVSGSTMPSSAPTLLGPKGPSSLPPPAPTDISGGQWVNPALGQLIHGKGWAGISIGGHGGSNDRLR